MVEMKFEFSSELEGELKAMFTRSAIEAFAEVSKAELNSKEYFNLTQACEWLSISHGSLTKWIREYDLPVVRIAGKKFISKQTLIQFMMKHEK